MIELEGTVLIASDFHLGANGLETSKQRELKISAWLLKYSETIDSLILVGDIFDYWYEYKEVVPKGFSHFWAAIRNLRDKNIPIYFFTGNHDLWMDDYPKSEYGITVLREPTLFSINNSKCLIHHGDGLGPGDHGYKLMKKLFTSRICQFLFSRLHPNFAIWIMRNFSKTSRKYGDTTEEIEAKTEWLIQYSEDYIKKDSSIDYFIFGHRHMPIKHLLSNDKSCYLNLGDWLFHYTYIKMNPKSVERLKYVV